MGAGASYGKREKDSNGKDISGKILEGLPIVNEILERLEYVKTLYAKQIVQEYKEAQQVLIKDLEWLIENTYRHATIDTFAKKLFLTNQKDEYVKMKRLLSLFFKTEQLINRPDGRYDTFLASVLQKNDKGKLRISDDISILTWNYDSQFEIAYKEYLSFIEDYSPAHYYSFNDGELKNEWVIQLLKIYNSPKQCMLNYAWEHETSSDLKHIFDNSLFKAKALVIIGYTFPFFNREVDSFLFSFICRNVQTIYIQDPYADNIKESVLNLIRRTGLPVNDKQIILKKDVSQFLLPPEL